MNISSHLKKPFIRRRIVGDSAVRMPVDPDGYYVYPDNHAPLDNRFQYLTQEDLKREIEPSAHDINSRYQSTRPIKELVEHEIEGVDENGEPVTKKVRQWITTGYDNLETTRFGLQKRFSTVKTSHMAAAGFWIAQEGTDSDEHTHALFDCLSSWKDTAGLDTMWLEIVASCNETIDALAYLYATPDGRIRYKVYSYDEDYIIFPDTDENRNPVYFVLYNIKGKKAVDIFSVDGVSTWISGIADKESVDAIWWRKVRNWFRSGLREVSDDGWVKVSSSESQVPKGMGQAFYFKIPDIPSGIVQQDIEGAERSASFVSEGVKSATFDTLFVKATNIESLPAVGSHGSVLAVKGDVESLKAADAKRLAPSDISNVAKIDMDNKMNSILHSTMSVIVEPDILRSGADSSSAMRLCFVSEIQWCQVQWKYYYHPLCDLVRCFQFLVAKVENKPEVASLRVSVGQNIWIPANQGEKVEQTTKMIYAGMLSPEAGTHECDLNYPNDMKRIKREQEDKIYRETYIKLKAQADARRDFGTDATANDVVVDRVQDGVDGEVEDSPEKEAAEPKKVDNRFAVRP